MGEVVKFEYNDVTKFHKELGKRINDVDDTFERIVKRAMENTLREAEKETPVKTGELKSSWRRDVEKPKRDGKHFSQTATNNAFNEEAAAVNMEGYYASFVEEGHKPVPWRKNTHGIHMLAEAEIDTECKLPKIVDEEIRKLLGGLFS